MTEIGITIAIIKAVNVWHSSTTLNTWTVFQKSVAIEIETCFLDAR
ncbi:MAG: hypothetical protein KKH02_02455 [Proteobacteria bacterium]|nr:hypothetical protein [Pseudomonadota bacterium]MBU4581271.1 hypothetical protein [Pseudomonadota bacterium]MCG2739674.1 hypothetical protein [Syntrophaceae bacterium]